MKTVVHFRTGSGRYCIDVEAAVAVRPAADLVTLPDPGPDVAGVFPAEHPVSVLSVLGTGSGQVLLLRSGDETFGLLVEAVTGLARVEDDAIGDAPEGQAHALICGVLDGPEGLILMADPGALAARLHP